MCDMCEVITNPIPALLNKDFKPKVNTKMIHYPEEGIYILKDDKGIDVVNEDFEYINMNVN